MTYLTPDQLRTLFSSAMSDMYRSEVPQYQTLLDLVDEVNQTVLADNPALKQALEERGELQRLSLERHGAIRVGRADELAMLRRLFAVMGMYPVGYYDLSSAGVPVHSTAFRPVDEAALQQNPFRIFTSLLRLELIQDQTLREQASQILQQRDIFTPALKQLVELAEQQGGLNAAQGQALITEALETFRWHDTATVDAATYQALLQQHRLIADVVCFRGPHINHLTPRTLDIDAVQLRMPDYDITPKAVIEGPPRQHCPVLLRQTSFKALQEAVRFTDGSTGQHTARFGEIEQRGMALTLKGREIYDRLLNNALTHLAGEQNNASYQQQLSQAFETFPDHEDTLRTQKLAYFRYRLSDKGREAAPLSSLPILEQLIDDGLVLAEPIIYEDFLPVSAAGIFQSNLGDEDKALQAGQGNQDAFEDALGTAVLDPFQRYADLEQESLNRTLKQLTASDFA
ncbi:2-oxoadipate dioxygenase/decarboxylase HglS [Nitrincola sp. A-D6]|uniref:2-oxoadipate dioxygenase/decarboxylase HglS n=1 Tax=Nitrincola sp. A-D6 TaxID=1545442 RepID=UPI00118563C7|nr:VOC family protein [Nitrincola sp. A-D6]